MSKAHHNEEAMYLIRGALNCHREAKIDGQAFVVGYIAGHVKAARQHMQQARALPGPRLP